MKIDVTPTEYQSNDYYETIIKSRGIPELYVVQTQSGENYTVLWEKKDLDEFQPKRTVSEMMKSWEETLQRRYDEAFKMVQTKRHLTLKVWSTRNVPHEYIPGRMVEEDYETNEFRRLDKYDIAHQKHQMEKLLPKLGKMVFARIS